MVQQTSLYVIYIAAFTLSLCIVVALARPDPSAGRDILQELYNYEDTAPYKRGGNDIGYDSGYPKILSREQVIQLLEQIGRK